MAETLRDILDAAARGVFPPPDGRTTVVPQPSPRDAGVLSFTAHSVVFVDEDPEWVYDTLRATPSDALAASMNSRFLTALMDRTGREQETIDALLVAGPLPGRPDLALTELTGPDHSRVAYARARRDEVRAWAVAGGVVTLGRGVAGRLEVSAEVDEGYGSGGWAGPSSPPPGTSPLSPCGRRSPRGTPAACGRSRRPAMCRSAPRRCSSRPEPQGLNLSARARSSGCPGSRP